MSRRFEGKTAVVTGAGGTIGRAAALRLASEGARVLSVDLSRAAAQETARLIIDDGGSAAAHRADVSQESDVARYVEAAEELAGGRVDAFFNNAGIEGPVAGVVDYDAASFDHVMAVNVRGAFLGLKYVGAAMGRGGAIVNTASSAGLVGAAGLPGYVASKHAIVGLTRAAAMDLAETGIRVNAIAPGPVAGRMMGSLKQQAGPGGDERFLANVPLARCATPEEVAATVAFLLSGESSYSTGGVFSIDGGQTAH